ncbi:hypothetical protein V8C44DRAFT_39376 [Trichoderma aethiopicum]
MPPITALAVAVLLGLALFVPILPSILVPWFVPLHLAIHSQSLSSGLDDEAFSLASPRLTCSFYLRRYSSGSSLEACLDSCSFWSQRGSSSGPAPHLKLDGRLVTKLLC